MSRLSLAALFLLAAIAAAAQSPHTHQHSFGDGERWAHVFDDPKRDAWQKPHEVIQALALEPGAVVADIGAGTGYFAVRLANMLPEGPPRAARIPPKRVIAELQDAGYVLGERHRFLPNQYFLVFRPAS